MKKILILSICTLFFLTSITFVVNANILSITSSDDNPPDPPVITGPTSGKIGEIYTYRITMSDPDVYAGLLRLEVNFGDGIISMIPGCCGKVWENPTTINVTHKWENSGNYNITGRVMDTNGNWSKWSDPLPIIMPYTIKPPFQQFLVWLFQRFPHAFPILRQLLGY
jgi:hypothetical protein